MKLHRSSAKPDWEKVAEAKRNRWQRLAARTHWIVTPANAISVLGLGLVGVGVVYIGQGHYWQGAVCMLVGRLCDILDGTVAQWSGTKSILGEAIDAACDKLGGFATLIVFSAAGLLWWPFIVWLGLQQAINSAVGMIASSRHYLLHPIAAGKLAEVGKWTALLGLVSVAALDMPHNSALGVTAYGVLIASLLLGSYATFRYVRFFVRRQRSDKLGD